MKSTIGSNVKYIDGIYKSPQAPRDTRSPIQVELPLETPKSVSVTRRTTKQVEESQPKHDKFYDMATAALTGVGSRRSSFTRLRRTRKQQSDQNAVTIAQAIKSAELSEEQPASQYADAKSLHIQKLTQTYRATVDSIVAKRQAHKAKSRHFVAANSSGSNSSKFFTLQTILILMLSAALCATLFSYFQYKSKMNSALQAQQAQSDAEWQQLQASWQCINNKWEQIQSQPEANPVLKGDVTC